MLREHYIKLREEYFDAVASNNKTCEIRKNDRNYKVGDRLILEEVVCSPRFLDYRKTGRKLYRQVTHITNFMQREQYVVLSMVPCVEVVEL